ncbi:MFS transporter [Streptomyces sp. AV19]|uniref:MFS transporter n=1 Tax=Streptomyces sp. AV19 TaxID=2793068 RepID=UPI0018FF0C29|nr:MFS transporter [Streptomyces sp. AV19]MBH1934607.1 MFS transporter [Streptomyces sp. AV19]MDG4530855.1 MFS transporter [Streptomyces sp. AV19]
MSDSEDAGPAIRLGTPTGRYVLLTAVLGSGMALLDSTVVNVALPHIGTDLHADLAVLQWTVNAYMLTLAGLILLGGALGDRFGRRRVFVVGIVWFALASLLCGIAPSAGVLIAARALQGIGGALLTPGSLALLQAVFHPDDRAGAVGAWSGLGGVASAVGPFVGGWLVDGPGWRWVFLINLPIAAVCVPVALRYVPETRDPTARGRFDVLGAVLGALALGLTTYALIAAPDHGASPAVIVPGVAGVLLGVLFVRLEGRLAEPMLPPGIFASRTFSAVNAVTVCVYAAFSGFFFLSVLQLQIVAGWSALAAGTALLPTTVLMLLLSSRAGRLGQAIGPRLPLTVGPLLCAAGMLLMTRAGQGAVYWRDVLPALVVLGLGMSALVAPLTATVLASVDVGRAGLASGINNAAARAAGLVAVAALPLVTGMGPEAYRDPTAFGSAFRWAMVWCAVALVAGALLAWTTIRAPQRGRCHPECAYHCGVASPPLDPGER